MLYSHIFGKTKKTSKEFDSANATLLIKAGFVDQTMAGVYSFLPLGKRVLSKIENIIREEMDTVSSELLMPSITPKALWEQTGRINTVSVLMKAIAANPVSLDVNDAEYILNPTHEEIVTPLAKKYNASYKDFPFSVYQIQTKFRNEPRAKSGLLRCREFRMKDLYSFHTSEEGLELYYEKVKKIYLRVFERFELRNDTVIALASGGDFTEKFSHEFQTRCEAGEDTIFYAKKAKIAFNKEVAPSRAPEINDSNEKELPMQKVEGKGIIGVGALAKFLKIPVEKTTKTIIFENEKGEIIAAAVRGNYEINLEKLKKVSHSKNLVLASSQIIKKVTKAKIGYAGILHLPNEIKIYMDDSIKGRKNFECGANKTNYHAIHVNFGRDLAEPKDFYDIKTARTGDSYPPNNEEYEIFKACEVGNIFPLDTKFTQAFDYTFTNELGKKLPIYMGSYGIGSTRVMGVIVEKFHDDKGIIWPKSVTPFHAHLIALGDSQSFKKAQELHEKLETDGIEILFDDRPNVSAGEKFSDADLIGIPWRIVISKKTADKIEIKKRSEKSAKLVSILEGIKIIKKDYNV